MGILMEVAGKPATFFDLIIELENNVKLKTKIDLELPAGNILENGIETIEETNMKTVFKRI